MKYILSLLALITLTLPQSVFAMDVPKDSHLLQNCVLLDNPGDFPDYSFYAALDSKSAVAEEMLVGEKCFDEEDSETGDRLILAKRESDEQIIPSEFTLQGEELSVFDTIQAVKRSRIIHISSITSKVVVASVVSSRLLDEKGHEVTLPESTLFSPSSREEHSWVALLSLAALIIVGIGAVVLFFTKKRSR
jgi:hypothetical protein